MDPVYKKSQVVVRPAVPRDAEAFRSIRNRAIEHSTALWTNAPLSEADGAAWLSAHLRRGSAFAAEASGEVVGFAVYGPWRHSDGYRHTVEDSVYVKDGEHRRGIGSALLGALVEAARHAGHRIVIADIEAGNTASIKLHERFGFEHVGTIRDAGTKFGRRLDLTIMRLPLA